MGLGKVHDVYVVAQARPVGSGVVIAEYAQAGPLAYGCLGDEGNQVVGHSARQLAYQGRRMGPDGVEIAQGYAP